MGQGQQLLQVVLIHAATGKNTLSEPSRCALPEAVHVLVPHTGCLLSESVANQGMHVAGPPPPPIARRTFPPPYPPAPPLINRQRQHFLPITTSNYTYSVQLAETTQVPHSDQAHTWLRT